MAPTRQDSGHIGENGKGQDTLHCRHANQPHRVMSQMASADRADRFWETLAEVTKAADVDQQLAAMLADPALTRGQRIDVAAELGKHHGPAGSAALRQAFSTALADLTTASKSTRRLYCDLACASAYGLARRDGAAATDIYMTASSSPNAWIRRYGLLALAPFGDDRAWEQVLASLVKNLRRKTATDMRAQEAFYAIEYLARHAGRGSDRAARLVTLLRKRWEKAGSLLIFADHIKRCWPGIQPGGPPATDLDLPSTHTPQLET